MAGDLHTRWAGVVNMTRVWQALEHIPCPLCQHPHLDYVEEACVSCGCEAEIDLVVPTKKDPTFRDLAIVSVVIAIIAIVAMMAYANRMVWS